MGKVKTTATFKMGGPYDGASRPVPNRQNLVLTARLYIVRDPKGALQLVQDRTCAHAYVRLDDRTFLYDGLRKVDKECPVRVEIRSFTWP